MNKYTFTYPIRVDGEIEVSVHALSEDEAKIIADRQCRQRDVFNDAQFRAGTIRFDKRQLKSELPLPEKVYTYDQIVEESKKSKNGLEFLTSFRNVWFEVTLDTNGKLDSIRTRKDDLSYWHEMDELTEREEKLVPVLPELSFSYLQEVGE